ncbi:MAG: hypothetical protein WD250_00390 [Egibacteraceae bacterium]
MSEDPGLERLRGRLAALEEAPLGEHPDVLDEVHRALVAELGSLAETRAEGTSPRAGT